MLILKLLYRGLNEHISVAGSDPRTRHLPLVSNYMQILALLVGYVVLVTRIGPAFMAKRKPYNIKSLIKCYNIGQIILNTYIFIGFIKYYARHPRYNWLCMGIDKTDYNPFTINLIHVTYVCYMSKVLDILDTIFFVMRKKFNQISFLHVYHHTSMIWASFIYHNKFAGSMFTEIGHVNSLVHILMYTYYLVSALETNLNLEAWKPRVTQIQIVQFCYISIKFGAALLNGTCNIPTFWLSLLFTQNLFMTLMFCSFYYKTYIVKQRKIKCAK